MADDNRDVLIDVQNVSKRFCKDLKRSIRYGFMDSIRAIAGKSKTVTNLRKEEFWAVKDVTFQLRRGECLGLIGHNGAGKSTLLKMLNGLIRPDQGKITIRGKIGALIELGAGFNPILTGRENIYNNGAVLGFSRKEIDAKFEDIIDFAEIREFIDMPVQSYSSGMRVRLGFAVAAQMEPDVLLIDEVLAVGDIGFQTKCFNRINELLKISAIIFVSHSMPYVGRICNKLLLLDHGEIEYNGENISKGIEMYHDKFERGKLQIVGSGKAQINSLLLYSESSKDKYHDKLPIIKTNENIVLELNCKVSLDVKKYTISIGIIDNTLRSIALVFSRIDGLVFDNDGNEMKLKIEIPNYFSPEKYDMNIHFYEEVNDELAYGEELTGYRSIRQFKVIGSNLVSYTPVQLRSKWEIIKN